MREPIPPTSRQSRGRRWTAADKTRHLAAFAERGLSIKEFCAGAGVPRSSFLLWQQQARIAAGDGGTAPMRRATASFAQVEVVPSGAAAGITMVIRSGHDIVVELAGLDALAAVTLLSGVLKHRRR